MPDDFLADFRRFTGVPLMSIKKLASMNSDEGSPVPYEKVNTATSTTDIPELNDIEMIEVEDGNVDEDPAVLIDSD